MKNLNKILIIPIVSIGIILNFASADRSDCGTFGKLLYSQGWTANWFEIVNNSRETNQNRFTNFLTISQQKAIITKDDLNTAILNLKKYCCENQLWWIGTETCQQDNQFFNDNALESKYLFDHLFDVIMRRLNWLDGDKNIYTKTKMTLDDKWSDRRKRIDEKAKAPEWATPQTIVTEYQQVWKQSPSNLWYNIAKQIYSTFKLNNQNFLQYVSWEWAEKDADDSQQVAEAMKKYNERSLYDRYINACALSEYFYALLGAGSISEDKNTVINRISDWSCDKVIDRQIKWENSYVSQIVQKSSNLFLSNYVEWYMSYLYERQTKLQKLWKDSSDRRFDVSNAVPCLQHVCTK